MQSKAIILDGGLGTWLETGYNAPLNHKLWSSQLLRSSPELVKQTHKDYISAGAKVIGTASYKTNLKYFEEEQGSKEEALKAFDENLKISVDVAIAAIRESQAEGKVLIGGCAGPWGTGVGGGLEYTGKYDLAPGTDVDELFRHFHVRRMLQLTKSGVNFIQFETIPLKSEAVLLSKLLKEYKIKGWIVFSCDSEETLCSGDTIVDTVKSLEWSEYLIGTGTNCTKMKHVTGCVRNIKKAMDEMGLEAGIANPEAHNLWDKLGDKKQLVVYPNSGETYEPVNKIWIPDPEVSDKTFAEYAGIWVQEGASMIGGCCRVHPDTIAELQSQLG